MNENAAGGLPLAAMASERRSEARHQSCVVAKGLPDEETECSRAEGCGSINEVGWRFQPFGINDLEMVDQAGIEPATS